MPRISMPFAVLSAACILPPVYADDVTRVETRLDLAVERYGVSGAGVVVAIFDRGIDWRHPDFIKPDGTTRIKFLLDMTGPASYYYCDDPARPVAVEYTEADINAALQGGPPINSRDAVGHGTASAGVAAGNGRAFADGRYAGVAPEADLIIVKIVSDGAAAHDDQPAEAPFVGCIQEALDWLDAKLAQLGQPPCVGIINMGVQYGPLDGSSVVCRQIEGVFGPNRPGRVYACGTGDEGGFPSHAGGDYDNSTPLIIRFTKPNAAAYGLTAWYTGEQPAEITVRMDNGAVVGPVPPEEWRLNNGMFGLQYAPGAEPYPLTSDSGDRLVYLDIGPQTGGGQIEVQGIYSGVGRFDAYLVGGPPPISFTDHLAPGRLNDGATTFGAVVAGVYVSRNAYTDINGNHWPNNGEGLAGELWHRSSDGPTRDGRLGVDIATPGHSAFAAYASDSVWHSAWWNLIQDGGGWYGGHGAASSSGPMLVGAIALLLEQNRSLTATDVQNVLHSTGRSDAETGVTPNGFWGYGKLDAHAAVAAVAARCPASINGDTQVDLNDLTILLSRFGMSSGVTFRDGDLDIDADVDLADVAILQSNFGTACP
ncbi:MAG: S8 family serine peptidase [Phycisphaerales bacterium]|nr:S8 family serine peptidase [Phycisphaerales bacterium]